LRVGEPFGVNFPGAPTHAHPLHGISVWGALSPPPVRFCGTFWFGFCSLIKFFSLALLGRSD